MIREDFRQDPDELLKAVQKEETVKKSGKLKIFFGMSAGVGKTYAMLEEARRRLKEGVRIIAGTINTHGRKETEELLEGMPIIPEKWVKYRDVVFEEMDLEEILRQKPAIVLVDELAHTNVPGSRHSKRWQDVIEILDAEIDVYTTLNVQHLESRKDLVESIANIQIRETVPDLILERAETIELVDLAPGELLQRLKEGKVYLGMQSLRAAQNFFREDTLTALREIALRFTAEKVDHDLHTILSGGRHWKTREKLMVAIGPSSDAQQLIRNTRRRAFELDASWVAVYVDTGSVLSEDEKTLLTGHLNLVQELGGEIVMTKDSDIASALQRIARQKSITQLVIGRPSKEKIGDFFGQSLIDKLESENKHIDLLVVRQEDSPKKPDEYRSPRRFSGLREYGRAFLFIGLITLVCYLSEFFVGYKAVGFIYLMGIVLLSLFFEQGPILFAAVLSTVGWNLFFSPPVLATSTSASADAVLTLIFFFTASVIGLLVGRISKQELFLKAREKKLEDLYEVEREIAGASDFPKLRKNLSARLQTIFDGQFDIVPKEEAVSFHRDSVLPQLKNEKEQATVHWVLENGKPAGWSTSTLPGSEGLYLPIQFSGKTIGFLAFYPKRTHPLSMEETAFLQNISGQAGVYLDRYLSEERIQTQTYADQVKKIQDSVQQSVSSAFYVPLDQIESATKELLSPNRSAETIVKRIEDATDRLKILITNLLSSAELESGFLRFKKEPGEIKPFIEECVREAGCISESRPPEWAFPEKPVFLSFDPHLLRVAIENLFIQASGYSFPNTPLKIEGKEAGSFFTVIIRVQGKSLSPDVTDRLFDKFYSNPEQPSGGNGFSLSVVKSVIDIHAGKIRAFGSGENEISFEVSLPVSG